MAQQSTPALGATIERWLGSLRVNLDPVTGLIPQTADLETGLPTSDAEASQGVIRAFYRK